MSVIITILNNPIATMAMVLGAVQLTRFLDMTDPKTINLLRIGYISSQMMMLLFWTFLRSRSLANPDKDMVEIEEPANPMTGSPAKKTRMTISQYDAMECGKQMQQLVTGTVIMLLLHYYFGLVQPLFLQILLPWKSILTQPLVQIYLYRFAATGALKRPFKTPNPLSEFMMEQTAEADTSAAEPASVDAAKEDTKLIGEATKENDVVAASTESVASTSKKNKKKARKED